MLLFLKTYNMLYHIFLYNNNILCKKQSRLLRQNLKTAVFGVKHLKNGGFFIYSILYYAVFWCILLLNLLLIL